MGLCRDCIYWKELKPIGNNRAGACHEKSNAVGVTLGWDTSDPVPSGKFSYEGCAKFSSNTPKEH